MKTEQRSYDSIAALKARKAGAPHAAAPKSAAEMRVVGLCVAGTYDGEFARCRGVYSRGASSGSDSAGYRLVSNRPGGRLDVFRDETEGRWWVGNREMRHAGGLAFVRSVELDSTSPVGLSYEVFTSTGKRARLSDEEDDDSKSRDYSFVYTPGAITIDAVSGKELAALRIKATAERSFAQGLLTVELRGHTGKFSHLMGCYTCENPGQDPMNRVFSLVVNEKYKAGALWF